MARERETVTVKIVKEGERQKFTLVFLMICLKILIDRWSERERERRKERERAKRGCFTLVFCLMIHRQMDREVRSQTGERSKVIEERDKASH